MGIIMDFITIALILIIPTICIWLIKTIKQITDDIHYSADRINAIYEIMYDQWKRENKKH